MERTVSKFIKYTFLLCIILFLFLIFFPRSYKVPAIQKRESTQYWNLPTGSKIGYTLVAAKNKKKPYPIIYLHGGPGGHVTNRDIKVLSSLSNDGYDIYLYDQVGSGQSGRLKNINDYTVERHLKDIEEIKRVIGAEKIILIGQSWGAILALLFIADNPDKVDKIIFSSPGPIYPFQNKLNDTNIPDSIHLKNPFFTNAQGNKKANSIRTKALAICATSFGIKLASDTEADEFETYLNYEVDKSTVCDTSKILEAAAGGGFYARVMTFKSLTEIQNPRPKIFNSIIPILVIKGECDNQKWGFTNEYLTLFKNHHLRIIPSAGHYILIEQPALYIKYVRQFLNE